MSTNSHDYVRDVKKVAVTVMVDEDYQYSVQEFVDNALALIALNERVALLEDRQRDLEYYEQDE